jgi:hypothetical protein
MEQIYPSPIPLILGTDNSTAKLDLETGWSKGMRYLRKHQKVSISLFQEALDNEDTVLLKRGSAENRSDILTKPLDAVAHWGHTTALGLSMKNPESRLMKSRL